jgi:hypothetical protein
MDALSYQTGTIEGMVGDDVLVRFGEVVVQVPTEWIEPVGYQIYFAKTFENRIKTKMPNITATMLPAIPACDFTKKVTPSMIRLAKNKNEMALRFDIRRSKWSKFN